MTDKCNIRSKRGKHSMPEASYAMTNVRRTVILVKLQE